MESQPTSAQVTQSKTLSLTHRLGWFTLYLVAAYATNWSINYFNLGQWPILFGHFFAFLAYLHIGTLPALLVSVSSGLAMWPSALTSLPPIELLIIITVHVWRPVAFGTLVSILAAVFLPLLLLWQIFFEPLPGRTETVMTGMAIEGLVLVLSAYLAEAFSKLPFFRDRATSFRGHLTEYFTLFSVLPVVCLLIWSTTSYSQKMTRQFHEQLRSSQHLSLERIQQYLDNYSHILAAVAPAVATEAHPSELRTYLTAIHGEFPGFKTLFIADFKGQLLATSPDLIKRGFGKSNLSVADRAYFKAAAVSQKPYISQVFRGRGPGQKPIVVISIPLLRNNGAFAGIIAGSLQLESLKPLLHQPTADSTVALIDATGHMIVAVGPDAPESLASIPSDSALALTRTHTNYFGHVAQDNALVGITTLHGPGWKLTHIQPLHTTIYEINLYTLIVSAIAWLFVLASRGLAYRLAQQIAKPLEQLQSTVEKIRPNKPLVQLELDNKTPAEITRLAKTLNQTLHELEVARLKLKHAASEKTELYEQLQRQNRSLDEIIKEKTEALLAAKQEAETLAANRSTYLATMSHEIKTPLSGILGMLYLFERDNLTDEQREQIETIEHCAQSLLQLINDILENARMESGAMRLNWQVLDVQALCEEVTKLFLSNAKAKGLKLSHHIVPEVLDLPPILGDGQRIKQILSNLLSNAIKFSDKGEIRLVLTRYRTESSKVWLKFTVIDQGIGIPKAHLDRIFKPFEQVDQKNQPAHHGSGLGLAISRKLAILMGGHLEADSVPGKGTKFSLLVPVKLVDQARDKEFSHLSTNARILVVEDNIVNQKILSSIIRNQNLECDVVNNGRECLAALAKNTYDLIFMDCQMPEMDGFEATRRIRASASSYANIPIIAVTAHASALDRERCLSAGMDEHIGKPYSLDRIKEILAQFLTVSVQPSDRAAPSTDE